MADQSERLELRGEVGALIGSLFKTTAWLTVRRDTLTLTNPPGA